MKVIAGLGNPGTQYASTPHNVGFEAVDLIAAGIGANWEFKKSFNADLARGILGGVPVMLVKPRTFMNLSGDAIAPIVKYHNATAADLLVIHDDIDLPVGKIRVRKNGSAGGHNGLKSIIARLGTQNFLRLKLGVGKDKTNVIGHVLGKFDPASRALADQCVSVSVKACSAIVAEGVDKAMNLYNGWTVEGVDKK